jgi:hypothetical protein
VRSQPQLDGRFTVAPGIVEENKGALLALIDRHHGLSRQAIDASGLVCCA